LIDIDRDRETVNNTEHKGVKLPRRGVNLLTALCPCHQLTEFMSVFSKSTLNQ